MGRALIGELERFAWRCGARRVWRWTGQAEGFYLRCGWRLVEHRVYDGASGALLERTAPD